MSTKTMPESYIEMTSKGDMVAFVGPDACLYFQARVLATSLSLASISAFNSRELSPSDLLFLAQQITRTTYKQDEFEKAAREVHAWSEVMFSALPVQMVQP